MQPTRHLLKRSVWKGKTSHCPVRAPSPPRTPLNRTALESDLDANSLPIVRPAPGQKVVPIRTQARSATILPNFVGLKFQVYNGKAYIDVTITEDMVGHKLGEFSPTRKPFIWSRM
ncbi:37S ribosomal protein S19 [Colletotrichum nymphaeae SA-01]|uniref:37S ribosomal protein S19 n=1 Tax=Colletotrichum nymphaeae SA-01 TaxID=1460502 RepID=A0A135SKZ7_9PEZI|nr:37S ribosomal protein S19 [Colletotrichum nymphaeae SA-01]